MYSLFVPVAPTALQDRVVLAERSVQGWTSILLALFSAVLLAFSSIIGYLADRCESRRWPFLFGPVASAQRHPCSVLGPAPSFGLLVGCFRVLQLRTQRSPPSRSALGRVAFSLSSPSLIVPLWGTFIISLVLTSFDGVLPVFVQGMFGWPQSAQGLIFVPLMVPHVLDPVMGSIIDKFPRSRRSITCASYANVFNTKETQQEGSSQPGVFVMHEESCDFIGRLTRRIDPLGTRTPALVRVECSAKGAVSHG
jgi:MFS family permease